jgi:hypothetical protein
MLKKAILAIALGTSSLVAVPAAVAAETTAADPAQLKLAEQVVAKLVPPGTYEKMMKDMAEGDILQSIMGMDMETLGKIAGENAAANSELSGKSLMDLAAEKDPNFKERMDITMRVMFAELGKMMGKLEPEVRSAMADIYARKYTNTQLADMNAFFGSPSGSVFASNFLSSFTDKEMMAASMKMVPMMLEALPDIMTKVEAATAHLPPLPKAAEDIAAATVGNEPWFDRENWNAADRKKVEDLETKAGAQFNKYEEIGGQMTAAEEAAVEKAKKRYIADGWKEPAPVPDVYSDEGRAVLSPAWSADDKVLIAKIEADTEAASNTASAASAAYTRLDDMRHAAYKQAMINAGQSEGEKRSVTEAAEQAGREFDEMTQGATEAGVAVEAALAAAKAAAAAAKAAAEAAK